MCCVYSHAWLFVTLWIVACQAPLSMGCSRQEYWRGLLCPPPGDLPHSGIEPASPALQVGFLPTEPHMYICVCGLPGGLAVKNTPAMQELQETWVWSLGGEDRLEESTATYSSILIWRISMDKGAWCATVHRITKSQTQLKWLNTQTHIYYTQSHTHKIGVKQ